MRYLVRAGQDIQVRELLNLRHDDGPPGAAPGRAPAGPGQPRQRRVAAQPAHNPHGSGRRAHIPGEMLVVKFSSSLPLTTASLTTPASDAPDGLQPLECVIDSDCAMLPVVNFTDLPLPLAPGDPLAYITEGIYTIRPLRVDRRTAVNDITRPPLPQVNSVVSKPAVTSTSIRTSPTNTPPLGARASSRHNSTW